MSKADHALTTAKQKRRTTIAVKPAALSQIEDVARDHVFPAVILKRFIHGEPHSKMATES